MAKRKTNWETIKAEYLRGGTSYRKLADKYGVSSRTIERRAKSESWGEACRQVVGKVSAELPEKVAAAILSEAERITRRHFDLWDKAITKAEAMLDHREEVPVLGEDGQPIIHPTTGEALTEIIEKVGNPRALKEWATGVKAVTEGQRLAAGIIDPNKVKADPNAAPDDDEEGPKHGVVLMPMKDELPEPPPEPEEPEDEE